VTQTLPDGDVTFYASDAGADGSYAVLGTQAGDFTLVAEDPATGLQREVSGRLEAPGELLAIARGRHVATAISRCSGCHQRDFGGQVFIDVPLVVFLYAANRRADAASAVISDLDWERAIRHSVKPDGSVELLMPSQELQLLNDPDTGALIAYLKTLPPVDREPMKNRVGPVAARSTPRVTWR
jgi:hypothetical protein